MPAIKVFDFAEKIKEYVRIKLSHTNWIVDSILVFYSTRSKQTKFGYKVVPLYVGVIIIMARGSGVPNRDTRASMPKTYPRSK